MIGRLQRLQRTAIADIALISPRYDNYVPTVSSVPLGLAWLAAWLALHKYRVQCFDLSVNMEAEERLSRDTFSIVCVQLHSEEHFEESIDYLRYLRKIHPTVIIVAGGLAASLRWKEVASDQAVDILVWGEGEIPLLKLMQALQTDEKPINLDCLCQIKGLAFKYEGRLFFTGKPEVIRDLNLIPLPNRSAFSPNKYSQWSIITSRGCPYRCAFCTIPLLYEGQCRLRSPNSVYEEICALHEEYGMDKFLILDDTFTIDRERVIRFCNNIIGGYTKFSWSCLTRADKVDKELLETLAIAGCRQISYGIESINQKTLDRLNKCLTTRNIYTALQLTKECGIRRRASLIFGLPGEKFSDIMKSVDFLCEVLPEEIQIYPLMPYSGLPVLADQDVFQHISLSDVPKYRKNAFHPLVTTNSISEEELRTLLMICIERLKGKGYCWVPGDRKAGKYGLEHVIMTEFCPAQAI